MKLSNLEVSNFRNIDYASLSFPSNFNVFYGLNSEGKTNLLEAIYFLSYLKSFRSTRLEDIISNGCMGSIVSGEITNFSARMKLGVEINLSKRKAKFDGQLVKRISDYIGKLSVVLFHPEDVQLLRSSPSVRRIFLDRMLFNERSLYLYELEKYQGYVKSKAKLLKSDKIDNFLMEVYNENIESYGIKIFLDRIHFFRKIYPFLKISFEEFFEKNISIEIEYVLSNGDKVVINSDEVSFSDKEELDEMYRKMIRQNYTKERIVKQVLAGPHRDDWRLKLNGYLAKDQASQGQHRSLVLSLKTAEILYLREFKKISPLLLLDDVSSELDNKRKVKLFSFLKEIGVQIFLTMNSPEDVIWDDSVCFWKVEKGHFIENGK